MKQRYADEIKKKVSGKSGKVRIECIKCAGTGSQKNTLEVRIADGYYYCHRCGIWGYLDRPDNPVEITPLGKAAYVWKNSRPVAEHEYLRKKDCLIFLLFYNERPFTF